MQSKSSKIKDYIKNISSNLIYKIHKLDSQNALSNGIYLNNEKLVKYAAIHYPETLKNLSLMTVASGTTPIVKVLIEHGYDPFSDKNGLIFLKKRPDFLDLFLDHGMSFEHLFGKIVPSEDFSESNVIVALMVDSFLRYNNFLFDAPATSILPDLISKQNLEADKQSLTELQQQSIEFVNVLLKYNFFTSAYYKEIKPTVQYYVSTIFNAKNEKNDFIFFNYIESKQQKMLLGNSISNKIGHYHKLL